jgi:hypothetical protein
MAPCVAVFLRPSSSSELTPRSSVSFTINSPWRQLTALVVGDDGLGDPEALGQLNLGQSPLPPQPGQAVPEALPLRNRMRCLLPRQGFGLPPDFTSGFRKAWLATWMLLANSRIL